MAINYTGPDTEQVSQQNEDSLTLWKGSPLLRRGEIALKDCDWDKANQAFDQMLNTDPENAEAYLGLVMAELKISDKDRFEWLYVQEDGKLGGKNMEHAIEFADPALKAWFSQLNNQIAEELKEAKVRLAPIRESIKKAASLISAGDNWTFGLKSDGTVVVTDKDAKHKANDWMDIVAVAAGDFHIVGLKSDGTVVAVGYNEDGRCNVNSWKDIVAVAAGSYHTVGLKSDGTVVAVGYNEDGQCNVNSWKDIVAVAAGYRHTVGLKSDGTVVAVGYNKDGQCNVNSWKDIVAVAAGDFIVGLKSDGTVVAVGYNKYRQCVNSWKDIVAVAAGDFIVGLKSDGTVVAVGYNKYGQCNVNSWKDIVAVAAGYRHTVGLKSDGTVVAVGCNEDGQCDVSDWKLFNSFKNLEQERTEARAQWAEKRAKKKAALETERTALQTEFFQLKGVFTLLQKNKIKARLAAIEKEMSKL